MGSIGNLAANLKGSGRYPYASKAQLAYRASKAALNMGELCMFAVAWEESLCRRYCWCRAEESQSRGHKALSSLAM